MNLVLPVSCFSHNESYRLFIMTFRLVAQIYHCQPGLHLFGCTCLSPTEILNFSGLLHRAPPGHTNWGYLCWREVPHPTRGSRQTQADQSPQDPQLPHHCSGRLFSTHYTLLKFHSLDETLLKHSEKLNAITSKSRMLFPLLGWPLQLRLKAHFKATALPPFNKPLGFLLPSK